MEIIEKTIIEKHLSYLTFNELVDALYKFLGINKTKLNKYVEQLIEEGTLIYDDRQTLSLSSQKGYVKGTIIGNRKGFAFCKIDTKNVDEKDVFIAKNNLNGAIHNDLVLIKIINKPVDSNPEGKVISILQPNKNNIIGKVQTHSGTSYFVPDDDKYSDTIKLSKNNKIKVQDEDKVVVSLYNQHNKVVAEVKELLGKSESLKAEQLGIIRSYNLKEEFDETTLNEAIRTRNTVNEKDIEDRKDFRKLQTITIDGIDARDFDDAISIQVLKPGITRLGVHIADVSHYVKPGSALDNEAFKRGTSVYFPDMVLPMLPRELSNGICSLNPNVDRLTLSVLMDLDDDCNVVNSHIFESVIHSKARMTYDEVTAILEGDEKMRTKYADFVDDIEKYNELSNKLEKIRKERGEIRFDVPECFIEINKQGGIENITRREHKDSHELIESFMVLCNEVVAKTFFNKIPFVFRVHEKPELLRLQNLVKFLNWNGIKHNISVEDPEPKAFQDALDSIEDEAKKQIISTVMLRSMMKARYSPECLGHFGLASTFYCHFTSPIRRYPDLLIHRIIKTQLHGNLENEKAKYESFVQQASEQSSITERVAEEVERAVDDYKKAVYMQSFIGEEFDGAISGVNNFGIFVELENTVEGLVRLDNLPLDTYEYDVERMALKGSNNSFSLGDSIRVKVLSSNPKLRQIAFGLPNVNNTKIEKSKPAGKKKKFEKTYKKHKKWFNFKIFVIYFY